MDFSAKLGGVIFANWSSRRKYYLYNFIIIFFRKIIFNFFRKYIFYNFFLQNMTKNRKNQNRQNLQIYRQKKKLKEEIALKTRDTLLDELIEQIALENLKEN